MKHLLAFALCSSLVATAAFAETGLTQGPPLADQIDAFPRLTANDPAALMVNAMFAALDADEVQGLLECDGSRSITVTAHRADLLSLTVSREGYCEGAAHPFHDQEAMTLDLTSGTDADWQALLPKSLLDPAAQDHDPNHPFRSQVLARAYLAALPDPQPDCAAAYGEPLDFAFWLDAGKHALALAPMDMAYAETACAETAYLPVAQLQALGADARLLGALAPAP